MRNEFEPLIVNESEVPPGITLTVGLLPPIARASFRAGPAANVIVTDGSTFPVTRFWSLHDALSVPNEEPFSAIAPPFALSTTDGNAPNVLLCTVLARNFTGTWPGCDPPLAVATRRPLA